MVQEAGEGEALPSCYITWLAKERGRVGDGALPRLAPRVLGTLGLRRGRRRGGSSSGSSSSSSSSSSRDRICRDRSCRDRSCAAELEADGVRQLPVLDPPLLDALDEGRDELLEAPVGVVPGCALPEAVLLAHLLGQGRGQLHRGRVDAAREGEENLALAWSWSCHQAGPIADEHPCQLQALTCLAPSRSARSGRDASRSCATVSMPIAWVVVLGV